MRSREGAHDTNDADHMVIFVILGPNFNMVLEPNITLMHNTTRWNVYASLVLSLTYNQDLVKMLMALIHQFITGETKWPNRAFVTWKRADQLTLSWIMATVSQDVLSQIINIPTAGEGREPPKNFMFLILTLEFFIEV